MIDAIRQYTAAYNRKDENSGERKKPHKTPNKQFLFLEQEKKENKILIKEQAPRTEENIIPSLVCYRYLFALVFQVYLASASN